MSWDKYKMNNDTKEKNGSGFSSQGKKPTI